MDAQKPFVVCVLGTGLLVSQILCGISSSLCAPAHIPHQIYARDVPLLVVPSVTGGLGIQRITIDVSDSLPVMLDHCDAVMD
jgi:hypothetical protein